MTSQNQLEIAKFRYKADDTVIYISHSDYENAIALIQSDVGSVHIWCDSNKL